MTEPQELYARINRVMADGERGALLLTSEEGGVVFRTQLSPGVYLGFDYKPESYPRITGGILEMSEEDLRAGIQRHYASWQILKNNFGVPMDEYGDVAEMADSVDAPV